MSKTLVIMAGGRSSRMKQSAAELNDQALMAQAQSVHKSLIPLGPSQTPLLSRLCVEAAEANIREIIVVTSPENEAFLSWRTDFLKSYSFNDLKIALAIQFPSKETFKPMGTADAVLQAMEQYPQLQKQRFVIANGDNLYSAQALGLAAQHNLSDHALINYEAKALGYDDLRISAFALVSVDAQDRVIDIVEKPAVSMLNTFRDSNGYLRVSMNLCTVNGPSFYPALQACPINALRGEKELPEAFRLALKTDPFSVYSHLIHEALPDLTSAADLSLFS